MEDRILKEQDIRDFRAYLVREEKSAATVEKYLRDARAFLAFAGEKVVTKELVMAWKESLAAEYAARTVNSKLAGLNSLLMLMGWEDCKVKNLKIQKQTYASAEKELDIEEYLRLLEAAKRQLQTELVMETICSTGIRVSELKFFTVEAIKTGEVRISNKGKNRIILIPGKLKKKLLSWVKKQGIRRGGDFRHEKRQTLKPKQHLVENEEAVRGRQGCGGQGVSP